MEAAGQVEVPRTTSVPLLLCTATATHFISLSSEWERVLGWTQRELASRPFADFIHPNDRDRTLAEAAKVWLPGYEIVNLENRFRARGGRWRRLRWTARADGATWVAVAVDVTDEGLLEPRSSATVNGNRVTAPAAGGAAAAPAAAPPASGPRWDPRFVAMRAGSIVACLGALILAVRAIGVSSATAPARIAQARELIPHMYGPLDAAGRIYTLGPSAQHPPAMLGPRVELRAAGAPARAARR